MRTRKNLTDGVVRDLEPDVTRYSVADIKTPGLELRVTPKGRKVWAFVYRLKGKVHRMTFGPWGSKDEEYSSREARAKAAEIRASVARGVDPTQPDPRTMTTKDAGEAYLATARWSRPHFERDVFPVIGDRLVSQLNRGDVTACLDHLLARARTRPQATSGGESASNRLRSKLGAFLRFCYERNWIDSNPARDIRPYKEKSRDRVLTPDEIRLFWRGLESADCTRATANALRMALVSGQRIGEICGMTWDELDGDVWRLPGHRTKNRRPHDVPLSDLAVDLVDKMRNRRRPSPYVFPGRGGKLHHNTPGAVVRNHLVAWGISPAFTPHDLRRSCATAMADLGTSYRVVSDVLNHQRSGVTAVYVRISATELKRRALQQWADYLRELVEGGDGQ